MRLTVSQGEGVFPEVPVLFKFRFLVGPDKIAVRLGDIGQTHVVPEGADAKALEPFYEEASGQTRDYSPLGLRRFIDEGTKAGPRKIGSLPAWT
jgi:hypothetical protein